MLRSPIGRGLLLAALMFVLGCGGARELGPPQLAGLMWPVGIATGLLVRAPRTLRVPVIALNAAVAGGSVFVAGHNPTHALLFAVAVVALSTITWSIATRNGHLPPRLQSLDDLGRLTLAALAGSAASAALLGLTAALTGADHPWLTVLLTWITQFVALGLVLPLFLDVIETRTPGGRSEQAVAWVILFVVVCATFVSPDFPALILLIAPSLGWAALRGSMRDVTWRLLATALLATTLTHLGFGPFPLLVNLDFIPEHIIPLSEQVFLLGCVLICLPFAMVAGEQRAAAVEAAVQRDRVERLVQSSAGASIIGTDAFGLINLVNLAAQRTLGYTEEELVGEYPTLFLPASEYARHAADLGVPNDFAEVSLAMAATGEVREWAFRRKDGTERMVALSIAPVQDENGEVSGYVSTGEDITDRVLAQTALSQALERDRRSIDRLLEVDRVKDQFISSVSHELRTPITNIVGYLELILDGLYGPTPADQVPVLRRIEMNSLRLLDLVEDLLALSSAETLGQHTDLRTVDLREVMRRGRELVLPALRGRTLELRTDVPDDAVLVLGDVIQLERLVVNLAANAVKFTPDGGQVTLRLARDGADRNAVIEVEDTGIGIAAGDRDLLFDPFFRSPRVVQDAIQGSGLGLSIAKTIAEAHRAEISVESALGDGALFRVRFPAAIPVAESAARA